MKAQIKSEPGIVLQSRFYWYSSKLTRTLWRALGSHPKGTPLGISDGLPPTILSTDGISHWYLLGQLGRYYLIKINFFFNWKLWLCLQYSPEYGVSALLYIIFLFLFQERSLSVTACREEEKNPKWTIITYSPEERKRKEQIATTTWDPLSSFPLGKEKMHLIAK